MTVSSTSLWRPARVIENRPVANGSMWIKLEATDKLSAPFEPGHVLGLGVPRRSRPHASCYTISRADPETRQFEHLYRVIPGGRMTPHLAALPAGARDIFPRTISHTDTEGDSRCCRAHRFDCDRHGNRASVRLCGESVERGRIAADDIVCRLPCGIRYVPGRANWRRLLANIPTSHGNLQSPTLQKNGEA